jgi:hypothetical protein
MAASSSTNKLQNSYFFYGTHPLKVPTTLVHANSSTTLSTSSSTEPNNSTHLSLNLANNNHYHHGFSSATDLSTTKSLHNFVKDADENNEVKRKRENHFFCLSHMYVIVQIISLSG